MARIGRTSIGFEHAIVCETQQAVVAEGTSTTVVFDYQAGKPHPVPESVRRAIESLEAARIRMTNTMPRIPIDDLDDPRLAIYRSLKTTNLTRGLDQFVVEGEKLVARLLESRFPLVSVLVTDRHLPALGFNRARRSSDLRRPSRADRSTRRLPVSPRRARLRSPAARAADRGNRRVRPAPVFLVVCPKLSDPENLGAIARISDVFGVDAIMTGSGMPRPVLAQSASRLDGFDPARACRRLGPARRTCDRPDPINSTCVYSPPCPIRRPSLSSRSRFRRARLWSWATRTAASIRNGSRDATQRITIPMRRGARSLNVAVAAGILIHAMLHPRARRE